MNTTTKTLPEVRMLRSVTAVMNDQAPVRAWTISVDGRAVWSQIKVTAIAEIPQLIAAAREAQQ